MKLKVLPKLTEEFKFANSLQDFLRCHVLYCHMSNIDQILESDKVPVKCCECGDEYKVHYDAIAKSMFCDKHIEEKVTQTHIDNLKLRLSDIQKKLMQI
jgi:hypothetical protein